MKKKLLVILGAGSSMSCNMPSTAMLDELMRNWSRAWATSHSCQDYFDALWQAIEIYHYTGKASVRPPMNFEKVLGEMIALSHWMTPPPWGDTLRQTACDGTATFQPPPRRTQRADFPHCTPPFAPRLKVPVAALGPRQPPHRSVGAGPRVAPEAGWASGACLNLSYQR
jgi:hypothetical protein